MESLGRGCRHERERLELMPDYLVIGGPLDGQVENVPPLRFGQAQRGWWRSRHDDDQRNVSRLLRASFVDGCCSWSKHLRWHEVCPEDLAVVF
jgi:hypothetical protein